MPDLFTPVGFFSQYLLMMSLLLFYLQGIIRISEFIQSLKTAFYFEGLTFYQAPPRTG